MKNNSEFKVSFGRVARTLIYEDSLGTICFAFDVSPAANESKGKWNLHLGQQPIIQDGKKIECETQADKERVSNALERIKQYASSRGYQVV